MAANAAPDIPAKRNLRNMISSRRARDIDRGDRLRSHAATPDERTGAIPVISPPEMTILHDRNASPNMVMFAEVPDARK
jgi:hypothetical protein